MADAVPSEKLRQYLRELKPQARALLAAELERKMLRGEEPPGTAAILEALRKDARREGRKLVRIGNAQRLFYMPLEPFLVDDTAERKHQGRIVRACLTPIWDWMSRDLMPNETKTYSDQVNLLLAANERNGVDHVVRAFQDLAEHRIRDALIATRSDDKAQQKLGAQVGTPHAIENLRELAAILKARDALAIIGSRLPQTISNLAEEQLANVYALLESPIGRHRDVFLYAMLIAMSRLGAQWQIIRVPMHAVKSDVAQRVAATPYAVAVDVVLTDVERMIHALWENLKAGQSETVASLLKDIHDTARALHTEMDLSGDSPWARQLAASRAEVSRLLEAQIENLPGQVRRLLRHRAPREIWAGMLDEADVADVEAKLALVAACRPYAAELAVSEATRRVTSDLQNYFDNGMQPLIDRLRTAPPAERGFRQSQVDAAVKFCAQLFGDEYASLQAKAADFAAKDEPKAAKA